MDMCMHMSRRCGLPDRQLLAAQAGAAEGGAGRARGSPLPRGEAEEARGA